MKKIKLEHSVLLTTILTFSGCVSAEKVTQEVDSSLSNQDGFVWYTADSRISLAELASKHKLTVEALNALNQNKLTNVEQLEIGQSVKLPMPTNQKEDDNLRADMTLPLPALNRSVEDNLPYEVIAKTPLSQYVSGSTDENLARLAQTAATEDWSDLSGSKLQERIENYVVSQVQKEINQEINQQANEFLGRFGKAEVNISIDKEGKLQAGALRVFTPLYDTDENLLFSQAGVHEQGSSHDKRVVGNFGLGYRYETPDWLAGANIFIDHDFTGSNTRLGIGGEYWRDYLKLSSNIYAPLSTWKESEVLKNYERLIFDERPAKGFDIRTKGYVPDYPHIGGGLIFEQYFGDEVALFNTQERQKNPYALTFGLDYTPIPLITADVSHKMGKSGAEDTRVGMNVNLQLGTPIEKQLDPSNVALSRSLKGSRYDIVDRNYDMVFEYRQENFSVKIDGPTEAKLNQPVNFTANIQSRAEITDYDWVVIMPSGVRKELKPQGNQQKNTFSFTPNLVGKYTINLQVKTERGHVATSNTIDLEVESESVSHLKWHNDLNEAEVLDDIALSEMAILDLPAHQKLQLNFMTRSVDGELIEVENPELFWRFEGRDDFQSIHVGSIQNGIRYVSEKIKEENSVTFWRFHIIADDRFVTSAVEFVARSQTQLDAISSNVAVGYFTQSVPTALDPNQVIFELYQVAGPGSSYQGDAILVTRSGVENNQPVPYTKSNPIFANGYYEVVVKYPDEVTGELSDITAQVEHSIEWAYIDRYTGKEVKDAENAVLSRCNGYPIYATQITNYESNDVAFGALLREGMDEIFVNEQQLSLIAKINYKQLQHPSLAKEDHARICFGEQEGFFHAEDGYVGFKGETRAERIATVENRKAGEWK